MSKMLSCLFIARVGTEVQPVLIALTVYMLHQPLLCTRLGLESLQMQVKPR
jgi:ABC-type proline/glycine betaine transport system permease subunit